MLQDDCAQNVFSGKEINMLVFFMMSTHPIEGILFFFGPLCALKLDLAEIGSIRVLDPILATQFSVLKDPPSPFWGKIVFTHQRKAFWYF